MTQKAIFTPAPRPANVEDFSRKYAGQSVTVVEQYESLGTWWVRTESGDEFEALDSELTSRVGVL